MNKRMKAMQDESMRTPVGCLPGELGSYHLSSVLASLRRGAEPQKKPTILMSYAFGMGPVDVLYLTLRLKDNHLTVLVSNTMNSMAPVTQCLAAIATQELMILVGKDKPAKTSALPAGFYDRMITRCKELFPRFNSKRHAELDYLCDAFETGNLTIIDRNKVVHSDGKVRYDKFQRIVTMEQYGEEFIDIEIETLSNAEAKAQFGADLIEEADRYFAAKRDWKFTPKIFVDGALVTA